MSAWPSRQHSCEHCTKLRRRSYHRSARDGDSTIALRLHEARSCVTATWVPHNTVYRDGRPVAVIDWDSVRPNHPLIEFGNAALDYVPLGDDAYRGERIRRTPDLAARLALFSRGYGLTDHAEVAWSLHQAKQRSVEAAKVWPVSPAEGAAALRLVADELAWLDANLEVLVSALRLNIISSVDLAEPRRTGQYACCGDRVRPMWAAEHRVSVGGRRPVRSGVCAELVLEHRGVMGIADGVAVPRSVGVVQQADLVRPEG